LDLLQKAAGRLNSPVLSAAALKVQVSADHFVKVRGLIKDLIAKLKADAEAEAESKGFCDKEMNKAVTARDEAKLTIEEKTADISKNEAEKAQLTQDISDLEAAIAANMKALKEATEQRNNEQADNEKTLADSDAGKEAVEFALTTLKEFYEGAFVQTGYTPPNAGRDGKTVGDLAPEAFSGTYHGNQAQSKGILGLLEVILSDFDRTLETVAQTEKEADEAFAAFEDEIEKDNDAKNKEKDTKAGRISDIEDALVTLTDEKNDAETKLDGALEELEKLKPMCVDGTETYEERVAKREEEIAALKEAMQILIDWQA
jgi:chromosome segregation ATPase